jgi:hypothetical protein
VSELAYSRTAFPTGSQRITDMTAGNVNEIRREKNSNSLYGRRAM